MTKKYEEMKKNANIVRNIDIQTVLKYNGCIQDRNDKRKWHTNKGVISVTKQKFMNWNSGVGGGAIDIVMLIKDYSFKDSVAWLSETIPVCIIKKNENIKYSSKKKFKLPQIDDRKLSQVKNYLINNRCLDSRLIESLIDSGKLYADYRSNAVFLLLGKEKKVVGAELIGTLNIRWKGLAAGSNKNEGYFYVKGENSKNIVLCESAIDAISLMTLNSQLGVISTSGANPNPSWLLNLIQKDYKIYCGFDSDKTGYLMAAKLMEKYPKLKRLRPPKKDWNDYLKSKT